MSETVKKRAWFQIHLSTTIVLMFVAAGIMWLNLVPREDTKNTLPLLLARIRVTTKGWPKPVIHRTEHYTDANDKGVIGGHFTPNLETIRLGIDKENLVESKSQNGNIVFSNSESLIEVRPLDASDSHSPIEFRRMTQTDLILENLWTDIPIAFALIVATAFICEWRIRRREARAP